MGGYLIRRLLQMIPLLFGITFLSFLIMSLAPGNFFTQLRMNPAISPELVRQLEVQFGYGDPLLVQYAKWVWRVLHLDLGMSVAYRVNVADLIAMRAGNTIILAVTSMLIAWGLAIPMGVLVALRPNSWLDRALSFAAFFWMSLPSFFFAFLLMYLRYRRVGFRWVERFPCITRNSTGGGKSWIEFDTWCCPRWFSARLVWPV